ncbi:MAG: phosphate acyltransferase PlsX [Negativicutes bacterium]|nr:phosphate acyltransferase PlsX [Negativicutes bacterium]MBP9949394.1 phosphate acyltransferase PlsX [Negativicutes bacterium]
MKIAIDAMGGDYAPREIVLGAVDAVKEEKLGVVLVGNEKEIKSILKEISGWEKLDIEIKHTNEVIEMDEQPVIAVRKKKNASLVIATALVKEGYCDAVVSAGSTGAAVAAALFGLGRVRGIERPVIATPIPNLKGVTVLLDSGANVDSKPKHLVQSGIMGSVYAEYVFGISNPRVGLLNIGEEETKGNEQVLTTYEMLKALNTINFIGNAEGRDVPKGNFDVVVCDGFVGNVVLKFAEGLISTLKKLIISEIKSSNIFVKIAALILKKALGKLGKRLDHSEYGGALLLGVNGCFIICHGSSKAKAIKNSIKVASQSVQNEVIKHIRDNIAKEAIC